MADLAQLEAKIRVLEDIEAIRKLKAKYWRCIDKKLWSELENVFAEEATLDYGSNAQIQGRKAIVRSLRDLLEQESVVTAHGGHNAEIEITGDTTARAIWALQDYVAFGPNRKLIGYGHYEDEYVKERGQWKKKSTKVTRLLEEWIRTKY